MAKHQAVAGALYYPPMANSKAQVGLVSLVGAGPGDPGLITVSGLAALQSADVVLHDQLVAPRVLAYAPRAELVDVGTKGYAGSHQDRQQRIAEMMIGLARQGRRVCRLKGGDPFVFGRGGEEAQALRAAGIPFEVIPGVSSGIAAPAYAGIPITHRSVARSACFLTGHETAEDQALSLDFAALAKMETVVLFMAVRTLERVCQGLIEAGRSPETPAAIIQNGTLPTQRTVISRLDRLWVDAQANAIASPAVTVIGPVVALRDEITWFDHRPLFGRTVLVTRPAEHSAGLIRLLESAGATVLAAPTITVEPLADARALDDALKALRRMDVVVFTSSNGVRATFERLEALGLDARVFANARLGTVGEKTAATLLSFGLRADIVPTQFNSDRLADELADHVPRPASVLLLRADIADARLPAELRAAGYHVHDVAAYHTRAVDCLPADVCVAIDAGQVDAVTFTSGSTVHSLLQLMTGVRRERLLGRAAVVTIGPRTADACRAAGMGQVASAAAATDEALVEAVIDAVGRRG